MTDLSSWECAITDAQGTFEKIATSDKLVTWAEESQFATQAIMKNPILGECAPLSIRDAVINVAAIGLTLNPAFGFAYLVPENTKVGNQFIRLCCLRVSFKGLLKIATGERGGIEFAQAEVVKDTDTFIYKGPCEKPEHHINNPFGDRGETVGVYSMAKTKTGEWLTKFMSKAEIDQCRAAAKTQNVWEGWYDEMAQKAMLKRHSKQWPMAEEQARFDHAVAIVNETEGSDDKAIKVAAEPSQSLNQAQINALEHEMRAHNVSHEALLARANTHTIEAIPQSRFNAAKAWIEKQHA
jgi:recombination protein RecT